MAYVPRGPLTDELAYGLSDATVRKANPNRGGHVERLTEDSRDRTLEPRLFGGQGLSDAGAAAHLTPYPERSHRYA
ncbi:hypothetical protein [Streptomyces rimosus]|uniref:hypothetical protein n=1 Tax=Streptomyces rimosus TaxID=1927 RepID=UPI0004C855AA|nr:hypothetical protein [Streptomyces rimosus]